MNYVDEDFAGDYVVLDRAIRKDFTAFDALNLNYTLNSVVSGTNGKVFVTFTFNRQVTSSKTGETFVDQGLTEFIFKLTSGNASVLAMKNPLIFGLSEADQVATGSVNSGENGENIAVDGGEIYLGPVNFEAGSFPTPENLLVDSFTAHHDITLTFGVSPDAIGDPDYEVIVEEAQSSSGPWTEVHRSAYTSNSINGNLGF